MLITQRRCRIWLARHRVDFRRAHNGLLAEAYRMNLDPFGGDVVIFIGRHRRAIKVLYADPTGLWVSTKKFTVEAMKTKLRFLVEPTSDSITQAELAMLIEGSAYTMGKKVSHYLKPIDARGGSTQSALQHHEETARTQGPLETRTD